MVKLELAGQKYGNLTVIKEYSHPKKGRYKWNCVCDCGNERIVSTSDLRKGKVKYCKQCAIKHHGNIKYPEKITSLYKIWLSMKGRCKGYDKLHFKYYKAKNISVCDEWLGTNGFITFKNWALDNGYKVGLSIERIDNSKGYCPENCKWIPFCEQSTNRTNAHFVSINGETKPLVLWCKQYSTDYRLVLSRIRIGWDAHKALTTPKKIYNTHEKRKEILWQTI